MLTSKQNRLMTARESLESASKMLSRFEGRDIPASEMSRILDAATQATQAAQHLHQLAGILQAEIAHSK
ncbi:hypothetical protein [Burkholderia ubonensis]|uniref:hypothetical protein n=1 Tax=Burkholderia ubonensis TaxID=101571 RepID=UPI000A7264BF|nr:hypothetical protein [Burkholderia ubonensis]